ncbi:MAG: glycosyltransferase family 2 protein [Candidatus Melainabacteria bacterium]|nr:glycosyltransferase family 2 protein [Candidatus Melainabacteria bacterium]
MEYSVVIPIFNEEKSVTALFDSIKEVMDILNKSYEVIFVDDGSTDKSIESLKGIDPRGCNVAVLSLAQHKGKSEALQAGFDHASGNIIITMDGDLQDNPANIPLLINKLNEGFDIVIGWRYKRNDPFSKKLASKIANIIRRILFKEKIHDVGCGLKAFKSYVVRNICFSGGLYRFFTAITKKTGYKIGEIKISHNPRKYGYSKYNLLQRITEGTYDLAKVLFIDTATLIKQEQNIKVNYSLSHPFNFSDFTHMNLSPKIILWIYQNFKKGSVILELGSGKSTRELSKAFKLYSVEHNKKYLNLYNSDYIYAPIKNGWYDVEILKNELPANYDILLVDGPPGRNIFSPGRIKFVDNLELFFKDVIMIFDDVNRREENKLVHKINTKLKREAVIIKDGKKKACILLNNSTQMKSQQIHYKIKDLTKQ